MKKKKTTSNFITKLAWACRSRAPVQLCNLPKMISAGLPTTAAAAAAAAHAIDNARRRRRRPVRARTHINPVRAPTHNVML